MSNDQVMLLSALRVLHANTDEHHRDARLIIQAAIDEIERLRKKVEAQNLTSQENGRP